MTLSPKDLYDLERRKRPELSTAFANARTRENAERQRDNDLWRLFYLNRPMSFLADGCYLIHPKPRAI
jgi:hypothetical protein